MHYIGENVSLFWRFTALSEGQARSVWEEASEGIGPTLNWRLSSGRSSIPNSGEGH